MVWSEAYLTLFYFWALKKHAKCYNERFCKSSVKNRNLALICYKQETGKSGIPEKTSSYAHAKPHGLAQSSTQEQGQAQTLVCPKANGSKETYVPM